MLLYSAMVCFSIHLEMLAQDIHLEPQKRTQYSDLFYRYVCQEHCLKDG